jgi:small basic protein
VLALLMVNLGALKAALSEKFDDIGFVAGFC